VATSTSWNNRFVLRRRDERDPTHHRIYKFAEDADDITDADNYFATAPVRVAKSKFKVVGVEPRRCWQVSLESQPGSVEMCVFQLKSSS
jgi:hypothetical protein